MPEADTTSSTLAEGPRRRSLAGGAALALIGAARANAAPAPTTNPDAELIAHCASFIEHHDRHHAFCSAQDEIATPHTPAGDDEWSRLDDLACHAGEMMVKAEDRIVQVSALTPAGTRAKAQVLLRQMRFVSANDGGDLARSLALDVLGRA